MKHYHKQPIPLEVRIQIAKVTLHLEFEEWVEVFARDFENPILTACCKSEHAMTRHDLPFYDILIAHCDRCKGVRYCWRRNS